MVRANKEHSAMEAPSTEKKKTLGYAWESRGRRSKVSIGILQHFMI